MTKLASRVLKSGILIAVLCLPTASFAASSSTNLAPDAALKELQDGNARFTSDKPESCAYNTQSQREILAKGQAPDAIVLSCADSRLAPEQVFDQGVGKIFTVRVAGNILNAEIIASIEYAIAHLGSRLIVVMGHESCGAVKAALTTPAGKDAGSPSLNRLVSEIRHNIGKVSSKDQDPTLREPVMKNVSAVATELVKRSKIVRDAVKSGHLKIEDAIYHMNSGKVEFWHKG